MLSYHKRVAKLVRYYQTDRNFYNIIQGCFDSQDFYPIAFDLVFDSYPDLDLEKLELEEFLCGLRGQKHWCPCDYCQSFNAFNQAGLNFSNKK